MKKINWKVLILTSIVTLIPIFIGLYFYNELPDKVAIHWDINNNPNNYFSKAGFVFGMPILMVCFQIFCCIISDVFDENKEANKRATSISKWIMPIMTIVLYIVTVSFALGNEIDIRKVAMIIVGVMFIIMGNYLPKTKGNNYLKVKINDEKIENKLKRIFGYIFILNGILFMISILFEPIVSVLMVVTVIIESLVLSIYSWIKNKSLKS